MENKALVEFLGDKEFKNSEFVAGIVANLVLLYIINSVMNWDISFIADSFRDLIPLFNAVIGANLAANACFLIYRRQWFWTFMQIILSALGYLMVSSLYSVFPFTFRNIYVFYSVRFALLVAMVVLAVAVFLHGLKFVLKFVLKIDLE
ncbi:hypothetical protein [Methanothermobacter sp. EMTCatA1]|jgi:hypothetical protein|uniref:hypothetical protein n=1 Tax=Methanothermobacter sp. EMTCatA1 TaxID=2017966 RepID=UPI000B5E2B8D|nr:hypothetical protein [Methanothermobacter sp. EMTCatA1]MDK2875558.1 hypothetical protein [Methanothermobacter sp.]MDN5374527.1 hypothetical protein [Methanothermobacter sp.]BAZ98965.1 hypothetical protein tca_00897 [Methanothermobacter sp. EMTCatA1]